MQRLTSVFGYGNVNLQGQSRSNREDDAIGKVVNRDKARVGLRKRRAVVADVPEQGSNYPGMVNLSGTLCYMNSILQAFASLTYLKLYLDQIIYLAEEVDLNTPIIDALDSTLQELNTPCSSRPAPVRPYHFIEALSQLPSVRRLLQTREHQDAHELFLLLTNAVAEELKSLEKERRIDRGLSVILDGTKIQRDKDGNSTIQVIKDKGIEKERLLSPWEGLTAIRRNCLVCGWCEVIRHEVTGAIDVTVPMNGAASIQECLQQSMAPEIIDDAYCDSCSLNLTINYYISEDQRLSGNNPDTPNGSSVVNKKIDEPVRLAVESVTPASLLSEPARETPRPSAKPTSAKKRRARDARALLRKLEDVKAQGSIGEIVGEGKAKARDLGLQDVKWVKGQGPSSRMSMIARPPHILTLHLNRSGFTPYGQIVKKTTQIAFPPILNLSPFTTSGMITMDSKQPISTMVGIDVQSQQTPSVLYRLNGVICHYGYTHSFGHFVAYRRKPEPTVRQHADSVLHPHGRWLRISDADVSEVPESAVLGERSNAFLLFYERLTNESSSDEGKLPLDRLDGAEHSNGVELREDAGGSILDALKRQQANSPEDVIAQKPVDSLD
ncbi:hypothetical protein FFLO_06012 [Filobasidium floriforme]|uniref:ubiquitinyl hydrolase 1 n=1 Tax=Filobasidium floriforme TaxID=5210 RepID=A0A8K0NQU9_9TREE|nr:hypothetical protein FFLO_06012 [Filobasidium floriforme]